MKNILAAISLMATATVAIAENRIDIIRPDAPELAAYGDLTVGVREVKLVNSGQPDIANMTFDATEVPRYDRNLTLQVWYPADKNASGSTTLKVLLRDGHTVVDLHGKGIVDAQPADGEAYPLIIMSHGYPGNRFLMSPLAENIASKGYVVVSIDHTDTTYDTLKPVSSGLVNRSNDQYFALDQVAKMAGDRDSFLHGLVDVDRTAIMGYSLGAYGTLISAGAGLTDAMVYATEGAWRAPRGMLEQYRNGSDAYNSRFDDRIKTAITFAPAGFNMGAFDKHTMKSLRVPTLFIAGSRDDVVGYEDGVRETWQAATGVDRALLTFIGANHNVGAPMAPPAEAWTYDPYLKMNLAAHYVDFVWDNVRMNNISAHFVTAWLDYRLKSEKAKADYMDLTPNSEDGVWNLDGKTPNAAHTYWKGFPKRSAQQLQFETKLAKEK